MVVETDRPIRRALHGNHVAHELPLVRQLEAVQTERGRILTLVARGEDRHLPLAAVRKRVLGRTDFGACIAVGENQRLVAAWNRLELKMAILVERADSGAVAEKAENDLVKRLGHEEVSGVRPVAAEIGMVVFVAKRREVHLDRRLVRGREPGVDPLRTARFDGVQRPVAGNRLPVDDSAVARKPLHLERMAVQIDGCARRDRHRASIAPVGVRLKRHIPGDVRRRKRRKRHKEKHYFVHIYFSIILVYHGASIPNCTASENPVVHCPTYDRFTVFRWILSRFSSTISKV